MLAETSAALEALPPETKELLQTAALILLASTALLMVAVIALAMSQARLRSRLQNELERLERLESMERPQGTSLFGRSEKTESAPDDRCLAAEETARLESKLDSLAGDIAGLRAELAAQPGPEPQAGDQASLQMETPEDLRSDIDKLREELAAVRGPVRQLRDLSETLVQLLRSVIQRMTRMKLGA